MAVVELAALTTPIADDDPCGPDLDLSGDADYMNFMARTEGLLPASFFDADGKPFDRGSIDFDAELRAVKPFLAKTRDLRLLVLLAKLLILNGDLEGFATCVEAIARLLRDRWAAVHPRGEDDDYSLRMAALASLDDVPPVVMPLQYLPIAEHRRFGPICFRHQMIASGQAKPREGEEAPDANTIDQALTTTELKSLIARRDWCRNIMTALAEVRLISTEHAGYEQAVSLERLPPLVDRIVVFLDTAIAKRDPSAALPSAAAAEGKGADHGVDGGAAADARTGVVRSNTDAAVALAAVADYFSRREPSSPALLLVRQAQQLIGKSFLEVMRILMPAHVEQANVSIGGDQAFELPVQQLAQFADTYDSSESPSKSPGEGADTETAITESNTPGQAFLVTSRQEAIVLMEKVVGYFGTAEPSSPVPHLVGRARNLANRDFMSILKDFLPESALKSMKNNGAEAS